MELKLNSIVQIQETVAEQAYIGLVGYVSELTSTTVTVDIYYPVNANENAYVTKVTTLLSQVHYIGEPNPNLLPNG